MKRARPCLHPAGSPQFFVYAERDRPIDNFRKKSEPKVFGLNFALAFLCNVGVIGNLVFFLFFNRYLEELGASEAQIGLYMGAFALGSVVVRPTVGTVVDTYGRKRIIYAGLALMILATTCYFWLGEMGWTMLVVRILHGAGFGCYITGIFTIITDDAPPARRAKYISVFGLSGMGTFGVLPGVAEMIIERLGFQALFAAALIGLLASMVISLFIKARGVAKIEFPPMSFLGLLRQVDLLIPLGALFVFCTGVGALGNFIAVHLGPKGVSLQYFYLANFLAGAVVRLGFGHLADTYGRRRVAVPSFIAGSAALFWLGLFNLPVELVFCGLLWGIGIGFAVPAVAASVIDRVNPQDRGKGLALFTASFDLGVMVGSFAYGGIAGWLGYSNMYIIASAVVLLAALIARSFRN
jgi:MFS family permease